MPVKKKIVLLLLLAALVLAGVRFCSDRQSLGCRIWADGELIYEGAGRRLEDVAVYLELEKHPVQKLRIEYIGPNGEAFPEIRIHLQETNENP